MVIALEIYFDKPLDSKTSHNYDIHDICINDIFVM